MSAPERIYLQWFEDESDKFMPEGVTWCADMIEEDDVEYVRADIAARATAEQSKPEGWKLVPVEPTKEMWDAVNKLDNQMAANGYDGKGCTIEQAWDCMLFNAPTNGISVFDAIANAGFKLMRNSGGFWLLNVQDESAGDDHEV